MTDCFVNSWTNVLFLALLNTLALIIIAVWQRSLRLKKNRLDRELSFIYRYGSTKSDDPENTIISADLVKFAKTYSTDVAVKYFTKYYQRLEVLWVEFELNTSNIDEFVLLFPVCTKIFNLYRPKIVISKISHDQCSIEQIERFFDCIEPFTEDWTNPCDPCNGKKLRVMQVSESFQTLCKGFSHPVAVKLIEVATKYTSSPIPTFDKN